VNAEFLKLLFIILLYEFISTTLLRIYKSFLISLINKGETRISVWIPAFAGMVIEQKTTIERRLPLDQYINNALK